MWVNRITRTLLLIALASVNVVAMAAVTEVDNQELQQLQADGAVIIDVRLAEEWKETGMLAHSHGVTFFDAKGGYDIEGWLSSVSELANPEEPIVLICASGNRSSRIAEFMDQRLGYKQVHNVTRGIYGWLKNDMPVVPYKP